MSNIKWYSVVDFTLQCEHCGEEHIKSEQLTHFEETSEGVEFTCTNCGKLSLIKYDDMTDEYC